MDPSRPPPELIDDAVAEILLRLPPAEPEHLFRAALVCKPWLRILCDPAFLRRYRAFHGAPPLLGLLHRLGPVFDDAPVLRFVPATTVPAFPHPGSNDLSCRGALDCRHGRVLLELRSLSGGFLVWDPVTGDRHTVPDPDIWYFAESAAVLCAAPGCEHLDCHGGPFRVVLLCAEDSRRDITLASVYLSETGVWSETVSLPTGNIYVQAMRVALVGDEIYFVLGNGDCDEIGIGVYDWARNCLSVANPPPPVAYGQCVLMAMEDGSLGLSGIEESSLYLWSRKVNSVGAAEWVQCRVIDLKTVMSVADLGDRARVIGFAEGVDVIIVSTDVGVFTFDLKSGHVRKVDNCEAGGYHSALPYMSFYTPDHSGLSSLARIH
ncbi:unnamed protein product [Urochloa decumbens]|uniref:F-box domain-containing protein n=1 Tax=Urochloa decumbens TaxID=240449 RepID=A0ABC9FMV1_9POAL